MKFVEKIKQATRYILAQHQTKIYLKAFNEAADKVASYEDFVFEVVPAFCNAEFWMRQTEHEGTELKKLIN